MFPVRRSSSRPSADVRPSVSCWALIFSVLLPSIHVLGLEGATMGAAAAAAAASPGTTIATTSPTSSPPRHQHHHPRRSHHIPHPSTPNPSAAAVFMAAAAMAVVSSSPHHQPPYQVHHIQASLSQSSVLPLFTPATRKTEKMIPTTASEAVSIKEMEGGRAGAGALSSEPEQELVDPANSLVTEYTMEVHFEHTTTLLSFQQQQTRSSLSSSKGRNHNYYDDQPSLRHIRVQQKGDAGSSACMAEKGRPCDHVSCKYTSCGGNRRTRLKRQQQPDRTSNDNTAQKEEKHPFHRSSNRHRNAQHPPYVSLLQHLYSKQHQQQHQWRRLQYQSSPKRTPGLQAESLLQPAQKTVTNGVDDPRVRSLPSPSSLSPPRSRRTQKESDEGLGSSSTHHIHHETRTSQDENATRPEKNVDLASSTLPVWDGTVRNEEQQQQKGKPSSMTFEFSSTRTAHSFTGINNNNKHCLDISESSVSSFAHEDNNDKIHHNSLINDAAETPLRGHVEADDAIQEPRMNDETWTVDEIYEQLQHFSSSVRHIFDDDNDEGDETSAFLDDFWIDDDDYVDDDDDLFWPARMGADADERHHNPPPQPEMVTKATTQAKTTTTTVWHGRLAGLMQIKGSPNHGNTQDALVGSLIQLPLKSSSPGRPRPSPWIALAPCTASKEDIQPAIDHSALAILFYSIPEDMEQQHGDNQCAGHGLEVSIPKRSTVPKDDINGNHVQLSTILTVLTLDPTSAASLLDMLEHQATDSDSPTTVTISLTSNYDMYKGEPVGRQNGNTFVISMPKVKECTPREPGAPQPPPLAASDYKRPSSRRISERRRQHYRQKEGPLQQRNHHDDTEILRSVVQMFSASAKCVQQIWVDFGLEGSKGHAATAGGNYNRNRPSKSKNAQRFGNGDHGTEQNVEDSALKGDNLDNEASGDEQVDNNGGRSMFSTIFRPSISGLWRREQQQEQASYGRGHARIAASDGDSDAPLVSRSLVNEDDMEEEGEFDEEFDDVGDNSSSMEKVASLRSAAPSRPYDPMSPTDRRHREQPNGNDGVVHQRGRAKPHRLVQRIHLGSSGGGGFRDHATAAQHFLQELLMLKENSMAGKLLMVLMSTVCGVGVGMFGALLFVVALKVRLFRSRRTNQGGGNQQQQQGGGGIGLNNLLHGAHHHGMMQQGVGMYKKVVPRGVLESFGVQTVIETSPTCTKTSAIVKTDISFFKKGTLTYAESVLEMEEGFEEIADRDLARWERRRTRSRALLVGGGTVSNTNDAGESDEERILHSSVQHQQSRAPPQAAAVAPEEGTAQQREEEEEQNEVDEGEDDQVVPTSESPNMEQTAATILNATRHGSYRRISYSRQGRLNMPSGQSNRYAGSVVPETMSATSSSISLSISFESASSMSSTATTLGSSSSSSVSLSTIAESTSAATTLDANSSKPCSGANECGSASSKGDLPFANANAQTMCAICLAEYEVGERVRTLPCYHQFHQMCIDPWLLQVASLCPICKRDLWPGPHT